MDPLIKGADIVSMFCRININTRNNLPIRSSEMGLLIFINQSEEPPSSREAVEFFKVSKPMVAGMVRSLEKKDYLKRGDSPDTNRRFTLLLTDKGKKLVEETTGEYLKSMAIMREGLGVEDYDTLLTLLERANTLMLEEDKNHLSRTTKNR